MKVVLCVAPIMDHVRPHELRPIAQDLTPSCPTLGIYLLAGHLRAAGFDVQVIDLTAEGGDAMEPWLPDLYGADLIGISSTSLNWPTVLSIVGQLKQAEVGAPIVVGGIHPTLFPDYIMRAYTAISFVIRSEGEVGLVALCRALESDGALDDVPNLSWRDRHDLVHNPAAPLLSAPRLAEAPLPAYDLLPSKVYPMLAVQSSRGCSFNCSFCSTQFRHSYRAWAPMGFVDLLEQLRALAGDRVLAPNVFQVVDDEWSLDRRRSIAVLNEMDRRGHAWRFIFDSRANDFLALANTAETEGYIDAVAPHTERFLVGAECGYDEGLKRIGKGTTVQKIHQCAELLTGHGLADRCEFSFILGLPWETKEQVLETVRFASELALRYNITALLQWYCQIPGSRLWDDSWRAGTVSPAMYDDFGFFSNYYLFTSGVRLSPRDVWDVMDAIATTHSLIVLAGRRRGTLSYREPAAVELNFPRITAGSGADADSSPGEDLIWTRSVREKVAAGNGSPVRVEMAGSQ